MKKLQVILKAFMLRRTKKTQTNGKPILNLPEKLVEVRHVEFSKDEKELYEAMEGKAQVQVNKYLKV
jgi:SNF2 family DNA or RNA helicase